MTFQSSKSNIQVSEETVSRVTDVLENCIPVWNAEKKLKESGVSIKDINNNAFINALIFG